MTSHAATRAEGPGPAPVSDVLLSHNRPHLLRGALASVLAQTRRPLEVTVVDNPSGASEEVAAVVAAHAGVRLIRPSTNVGYAGGMNRGIAAASSHYVLLTEDDIVLEPDCVERMAAYMDAHSSAGLLSPLVYNLRERTILCAGGEVSLGPVYRKRIHGAGERDTGQFADAFDVTCLDGAVLFARTDFLRGVGGFREEFFMYVESTELCARVLRAGKRLTVVPQAKAYHHEPPAGAAAAAGLEFHRYKNFFALYLLHARVRHLPEFFCRYALLALLRSAAGGRSHTRDLLRAMAWTARRAPALLRERRGFAPESLELRGRGRQGDVGVSAPPE